MGAPTVERNNREREESDAAPNEAKPHEELRASTLTAAPSGPGAVASAEKRVTVSGAIHPASRSTGFYIDPWASNEEAIVPHIRRAEYVLLYGARGSGKTTRVLRLLDQLPEFIGIYVSIQSAVDTSSIKTFWNSFSRAIRQSFPAFPITNTAAEFANAFHAVKSPFSKKVVLVVDEWDSLWTASSAVKSSFFGILREMKQNGGYRLQSVVGVGPFSILALSGATHPPFNVHQQVANPHWTEAQVREYLMQISNARGTAPFDERIVEDIAERTAGHPGLVCLCARALDETLRSGAMLPSYEQWLAFVVEKLVETVKEWPPIRRLSDLQREESSQEACEFLLREVLPFNRPLAVAFANQNLDLAEFLTTEGVLRRINVNQFALASPLMHTFLLHELVVSRPQVRLPVPWDSPQRRYLDLSRLVRASLSSFDGRIIEEAVLRSSEDAFIDGQWRGLRVPSEAVYHFEHFAVLRSWLPKFFLLLPEVGVARDSKSAMDLVIAAGDLKHVIAYAATLPPSGIAERINHTITYSRVVGAVAAVMVHFTVAEDLRDDKDALPFASPEQKEAARDAGLKYFAVMHVVHSMPWNASAIQVLEDKL